MQCPKDRGTRGMLRDRGPCLGRRKLGQHTKSRESKNHSDKELEEKGPGRALPLSPARSQTSSVKHHRAWPCSDGAVRAAAGSKSYVRATSKKSYLYLPSYF